MDKMRMNESEIKQAKKMTLTAVHGHGHRVILFWLIILIVFDFDVYHLIPEEGSSLKL